METTIIIAICAVIAAVFVFYSTRKDRRQDREHSAVMTALSPGPQILEMTSVRPSPLRHNRIVERPRPPAAIPSLIDSSSCDTGHHAGHDSSFDGGFDGGSHHGH